MSRSTPLLNIPKIRNFMLLKWYKLRFTHLKLIFYSVGDVALLNGGRSSQKSIQQPTVLFGCSRIADSLVQTWYVLHELTPDPPLFVEGKIFNSPVPYLLCFQCYPLNAILTLAPMEQQLTSASWTERATCLQIMRLRNQPLKQNPLLKGKYFLSLRSCRPPPIPHCTHSFCLIVRWLLAIRWNLCQTRILIQIHQQHRRPILICKKTLRKMKNL